MTPEKSLIDKTRIVFKDEKWYARHVHQSQYLVQVLKCSDLNCCKKRRSSLFNLLPASGLPTPVPLKQSNKGLQFANLTEIENYASLFVTLAIQQNGNLCPSQVYDTYCPSVQTKLTSRTCSYGCYFSSIVSLKSHLKSNLICKKKAKTIKPVKILGKREDESLVLVRYGAEEDVEWLPDVEVDVEFVSNNDETSNSIIYDIQTILHPIWENSK